MVTVRPGVLSFQLLSDLVRLFAVFLEFLQVCYVFREGAFCAERLGFAVAVHLSILDSSHEVVVVVSRLSESSF